MVKSLQKSRIIQLSAGIVLELFRIKEYNINIWQYRTKSVCRLCTPSACKFSVIFHKNAREYIKYSLRFLFHLTKNLTTHLPHNLCAVLPLKIQSGACLPQSCLFVLWFWRVASEFQRTCPQDRQTGSSIGYCIYDTLFLSLCQGFGGIFGEFNMFAKILPYFLQQLSEQNATVFPTDGQGGNRRQYRTKSVWRLCTPSALRASPHPMGSHPFQGRLSWKLISVNPPCSPSKSPKIFLYSAFL